MKDERPYSNMVWIYRISRDECEKEIKQKSNEKFWNVESCNDSQRNSIRFIWLESWIGRDWCLKEMKLKKYNENSEKLSHVTILHGFFAQLNWYVW